MQKAVVWDQLDGKEECCQPLCFRVNQLLWCTGWPQASPLPCAAVEAPRGQHLSSRPWRPSSSGQGTLGRKSTVSACRAGPQHTSLGRSVVLLEEENRTPVVQHFERSAEVLIILDVGRTLKAR